MVLRLYAHAVKAWSVVAGPFGRPLEDAAEFTGEELVALLKIVARAGQARSHGGSSIRDRTGKAQDNKQENWRGQTGVRFSVSRNFNAERSSDNARGRRGLKRTENFRETIDVLESRIAKLEGQNAELRQQLADGGRMAVAEPVEKPAAALQTTVTALAEQVDTDEPKTERPTSSTETQQDLELGFNVELTEQAGRPSVATSEDAAVAEAVDLRPFEPAKRRRTKRRKDHPEVQVEGTTGASSLKTREQKPAPGSFEKSLIVRGRKEAAKQLDGERRTARNKKYSDNQAEDSASSGTLSRFVLFGGSVRDIGVSYDNPAPSAQVQTPSPTTPKLLAASTISVAADLHGRLASFAPRRNEAIVAYIRTYLKSNQVTPAEDGTTAPLRFLLPGSGKVFEFLAPADGELIGLRPTTVGRLILQRWLRCIATRGDSFDAELEFQFLFDGDGEFGKGEEDEACVAARAILQAARSDA